MQCITEATVFTKLHSNKSFIDSWKHFCRSFILPTRWWKIVYFASAGNRPHSVLNFPLSSSFPASHTVCKWDTRHTRMILSRICSMMMEIVFVEWWTIKLLLHLQNTTTFRSHIFSRIFKKRMWSYFRLSLSFPRSDDVNNNRDLWSRKKSRSWDAKPIFYHRWFINKIVQRCLLFASKLAVSVNRLNIASTQVRFLSFFRRWMTSESFSFIQFSCKQKCKLFCSFQTQK